MRRIFLTLCILLCATLLHAQYTVHSMTDGVQVKSGSTVSPAKVGTTLRGSDHVVIPAGGKVEVLNNGNKKIYTSTVTGEVSVFDLIMNANKSANNHAKTVADRLNFGKSAASGNATVFKETGMVTRSMAQYDPEALGVEMDAVTLGRYIAAKLVASDTLPDDNFPVAFTHSKNTDCGLEFRLVNSLEHPVYFNIIKVVRGDSIAVDISRLGQPEGSYVLLPQQAVSRQNFPKVAANEEHILIMAPCQYNVDAVIEEVRRSILDVDGHISLPSDLYHLIVGA